MKRLLFTSIILAVTILINAQAPDRFQYQTVVRDNLGLPLANQSVSFRLSVHKGSPAGAVSYSETHSSITNDFGLVNLQVGGGIVVSGTMGIIDWGSDEYHLEVELDAAGGSSYVSMGTTQLLSVPYALSSGKASDMEMNDLTNAQGNPSSGEVLKWNGTAWAPSADNTGPAGTTYTGGTGVTISGSNVVSADLGVDISTSEIQNDAVTNAKIANNAVNTAKIANDAVTAAKIDDMSASNGEVLKWNGTNWAPGVDNTGPASTTYTAGTGIGINGSNVITSTLGTDIATAELQNNAVSTAKIANDAVTAAKIDDMGASNGEVLKWNGTDWEAASDSSVSYVMGDGLSLTGSTINSTWTTSGNNQIASNTGFIGIGTNFPSAKLQISAATGEDGIRCQIAGTTKFMVHDNGSVVVGSGTTPGVADGFSVNGNTGIGTTSPINRLQVVSATATGAAAASFARSTDGVATADGLYVGASGNGDNYLWNYENSDILIGTNNLSRMKIEAGGNVGIGITSPSYKLHVGTNSAAKPTSSAWTVASDKRLKDELGSFTDGLDLIMKIRPIKFRYNGKYNLPTEEVGIGTIAQELQEIAPYMVKAVMLSDEVALAPHEKSDEKSSPKEKEFLSVDYGAMDFVLVNAVQELKGIVDQQQEIIDALNARIEALETAASTLE